VRHPGATFPGKPKKKELPAWHPPLKRRNIFRSLKQAFFTATSTSDEFLRE
jgi:hypothetical protein